MSSSTNLTNHNNTTHHNILDTLHHVKTKIRKANKHSFIRRTLPNFNLNGLEIGVVKLHCKKCSFWKIPNVFTIINLIIKMI